MADYTPVKNNIMQTIHQINIIIHIFHYSSIQISTSCKFLSGNEQSYSVRGSLVRWSINKPIYRKWSYNTEVFYQYPNTNTDTRIDWNADTKLNFHTNNDIWLEFHTNTDTIIIPESSY